jgi:ABC-type nitrate/sulfonate/bicarbonate transport system permease component
MSTDAVTTPRAPEESVRTANATAPSKRRRGGTPLRGLLPLALGLALWQLLAPPDSPYFPAPSEWAVALRPLIEDGSLLTAIGWSFLTFVLGLLFATVIGTATGALIGANRTVDRALGPTLESLRVLPAAALVPLATLILGYSMQMKLLVVVLPATWPILLSVRSTRRSLSPVLMDVSRTLGLSRGERTRKILIPALTPSILLGIRVAAPLALIITLLVEIVTRINGLGGLLGYAQASFLSAQVYGLLVIAGALGFLVNWAVTHAEHAVSMRMTGQAMH